MKGLILFSLVLSANAFAVRSAVYCTDTYGKTQNVLSGEWDTCVDQLYSGDVCFTGNRADVIKILNSPAIREKFDGTDGEYIKNARYWGPSSIQYDSVDEANEWSTTNKIEKCR